MTPTGESYMRPGRPGGQMITECPDCGKALPSAGAGHECVHVDQRERRRLDELATALLEHLDGIREETGVDEWPEGDPRCDLYNAASAITEREAVAKYAGLLQAEEQIDLGLSWWR